jgi:membrane protein implicated in regulation of membrane protease activity
MYKASMVMGSILIGGVIFLAMFPGLRTAMIGVDTTGWLSLFAVVVRFLPYALIIIFLMWLLSKARQG